MVEKARNGIRAEKRGGKKKKKPDKRKTDIRKRDEEKEIEKKVFVLQKNSYKLLKH